MNDEQLLIDDITSFGRALARHSSSVGVLTGTPEAVSLMLFNRLWSNYRGAMVLWNDGYNLEANIVLRAAIESAICICANAEMGLGFQPLLLGDLAATMKKLVKIWRDMGADYLVRAYEQQLRSPPVGTPDSPRAFDWRVLAEAGGTLRLYEQHRWLSATSAHVPGLSLMRGVVPDGGQGDALQRELEEIESAQGPNFTAATLLMGAMFHARTIGATEFLEAAHVLEARLSALAARSRHGC